MTTDPYLPDSGVRKEIATGQVEQFKAEYYGHTLNLVRLQALPEALRGEDHDRQVEMCETSLAQLRVAIDATVNSDRTDASGGAAGPGRP